MVKDFHFFFSKYSELLYHPALRIHTAIHTAIHDIIHYSILGNWDQSHSSILGNISYTLEIKEETLK